MFGFGDKKKEASKKRVLIIEDDALLASVLMKGMQTAGFEVMNVTDGSKALEVTKKYIPQIILLDLILPGLDGFEVLKSLKADGDLREIPVFVLSNLAGASDVKSAKVLGAEEYFIKARSEMEKIIKSVKNRLEK